MIRLIAFLLLICGTAAAQDLSGLARLDAAQTRIVDRWGAVEMDLAISQPVPWRARVMADPPRLVLDFREVDFTGIEGVTPGKRVTSLRAGSVRAGWSRLVLGLDGPYVIARAGMDTANGTVVAVRLERARDAEFAEAASRPEPPGWSLPSAAAIAPPEGRAPLTVMLDPGHGGIDPGAERGGTNEATLMLSFARQLKEELLRDGIFRVAMTRDDDVFVPLETRLTMAREAGATVFISLHADALAEGQATGATLYTLAEEASDKAAQALAERHDRDDLLAGVDLTGQDDIVASVLMDIARQETGPRNERLALSLERAMGARGITMHPRPRQSANFSVLKSPEIPSILIELGFMSSPGDLRRLQDPGWRSWMTSAIRDGLKAWAAEDAALRPLLRR
ncbi:N-acetylmuramoyl-L-alanine amidase [Cereibacter sp. SYSU M97828]|nr:N-acetylmuramoyl-L-alanine amidase [Cereibacter flavus]